MFLIAVWIFFFFLKDKPGIIIWGSISVECSDYVCVCLETVGIKDHTVLEIKIQNYALNGGDTAERS